MKIQSNAFIHNSKIPPLYTCDGEGVRPPLNISDIPEATKSLAIVVDDPDAPSRNFVHWLVWNIDPITVEIKSDTLPQGAVEGYNDARKIGWFVPCPPTGTHHYNFSIYALDFILDIPNISTKQELVEAMKGHILGGDTLVGLYGRVN